MTFSHSNILLLFGRVLIFRQNFHILESHYHPVYFTGSFRKLPTFASTTFKKRVLFTVQTKERSGASNKDLPLKILGKCVYFSASQYGGVTGFFRIRSDFFRPTKKIQVTRSPHRPSPSFLPNGQSARQSYVARYPNPWSERGERCEGTNGWGTQRWGTVVNVVKGQTHGKVMGGYVYAMKTQENNVVFAKDEEQHLILSMFDMFVLECCWMFSCIFLKNRH